MITVLNKTSDIATEFGTTLSGKSISWFYNNQNPASPVHPIMTNGKLKDWIGYDHSATTTHTLDITPKTSDVTYDTTSTVFTITSDISWTVSLTLNGTALNPGSYFNRTSGTGNNTITLNRPVNSETYTKVWVVTVTGSNLSSSATVYQYTRPSTLAVWPNELYFYVTGGTDSVQVTSDSQVFVGASGDEWVTAYLSGDQKTVYVECQPNDWGYERTTIFTISNSIGDTAMLWITQFYS
jgi:hypothetical protein